MLVDIIYFFVTKTGKVIVVLIGLHSQEILNVGGWSSSRSNEIKRKDAISQVLTFFPPPFYSQKVLKYNLVYILHRIDVLHILWQMQRRKQKYKIKLNKSKSEV